MGKSPLATPPAGYFQLPGWIYGLGLKTTDIAVYGLLGNFGTYCAETNTYRRCSPSRGRMASLLGISLETLKRSLARLVEAGVIIRHEQFGPAGQRPSEYTIICGQNSPPSTARGGVTSDPGGGSPVTHNQKAVTNKQDQKPLSPSLLAGCRPLSGQQEYEIDSFHLEEIGPNKIKAPAEGGDASGFDEFWSAYPRRVARKAAQAAWNRAIKAGGAPEALIAAAKAYAASRVGQDNRFTAHPATWLNQERWEDQPSASPAAHQRRDTGSDHRYDPDYWRL